MPVKIYVFFNAKKIYIYCCPDYKNKEIQYWKKNKINLLLLFSGKVTIYPRVNSKFEHIELFKTI